MPIISKGFKSSYNRNKVERKFYQTWLNIRFRCTDKSEGNNKKRYFDRGITVCNRWRRFDYFFLDMWESYIAHYYSNNTDTEIDRKNNNKGYYKSNCRWVTHKENTNNRSSRHLFNGKTLTVWAEELGIKRSTLAQRIYVYGWTIEKTLTI